MSPYAKDEEKNGNGGRETEREKTRTRRDDKKRTKKALAG